jgi:hypothetical protein
MDGSGVKDSVHCVSSEQNRKTKTSSNHNTAEEDPKVEHSKLGFAVVSEDLITQLSNGFHGIQSDESSDSDEP